MSSELFAWRKANSELVSAELAFPRASNRRTILLPRCRLQGEHGAKAEAEQRASQSNEGQDRCASLPFATGDGVSGAAQPLRGHREAAHSCEIL